MSYAISEVKSLSQLRELFPNGTAESNWLFLSTGGFHGTDHSLDDVERIIQGKSEVTNPVGNKYWITVLVVNPGDTSAALGEITVMEYGEVLVSQSEIDWLRGVVKSTLAAVRKSQEGNY